MNAKMDKKEYSHQYYMAHKHEIRLKYYTRKAEQTECTRRWYKHKANIILANHPNLSLPMVTNEDIKKKKKKKHIKYGACGQSHILEFT